MDCTSLRNCTFIERKTYLAVLNYLTFTKRIFKFNSLKTKTWQNI